jgi:hypothetical protein
MVDTLAASRPLRWALAVALGPLTGPLALQALAHARAGDRLGAIAYLATIPSVWVSLTVLAAAPWMH